MSASARPASLEAGLVFSTAPIVTAVLLFAPLIKGGNRPIPLLGLELASLVLLGFIAMRAGELRRHLSWPLGATLGALAVFPLLQLLQLPGSVWSVLPGHDVYAAALSALGMQPEQAALTVLPRATEAAWLALLPPIAVFLTTLALPDQKLRQLTLIFVGMAVVQALISLAQFGTGSVAVLWYVEGLHDRSGIGTYANRDHLAGLLEMALPIVLAWLAMSVQRSRRRSSSDRAKQGFGKQLAGAFSQDLKGNQAMLLGAATIAILVGLVFSRSRTGLALGMLAILLCTLAFARRMGSERSVRMVTILVAVGLAIGAEIGLAPVLGRFTEQNVGSDLRWSMYAGAVAGIGDFFPLGSGFGTFPEVFRRFQPADIGLFVNHAHNDYLEWTFEGGLLVVAVVLVLIALYLGRWPQVWRGERWSRLRYLQVAAGISLFLMGLHGLVDFNLHIPANAIYFAFLAGLFFHREEELPRSERQRSREPEKRAVPIPSAPEPVHPPQDLPNPFAR